MEIRDISVPNVTSQTDTHQFFEATDSIIDQVKDYGGPISIVVQDYTRGRVRCVFLESVVNRFYEKCNDEDITIFIANGMHRACSDSELEIMFGGGCCGRYRIVQNNPMKSLSHEFFRFPIVAIHRSMPHIKVGFTSAGKMIKPGLSDRNDAHQWHCRQDSHARHEMLKMNEKFSHIIDYTVHPNGNMMNYFAGSQSEGGYYAYLREAEKRFCTEVEGNADAVFLQPEMKVFEFHQAMNGIFSLHAENRIVRKDGIVVLYLPFTHFIGTHYMFANPNGTDAVYYDKAFNLLCNRKHFVIYAPFISEYLLQDHFANQVMVFNSLERLKSFLFSRLGEKFRVDHYHGSDVIIPLIIKKGEQSGINV